MEALRPSGIPAIGEMGWGTHFCHFFDSRGDLADTLVPYFKAGLDAGEACLWVTAEPLGAADARQALGAVLRDLPAREASGQIEIVDYDAWYQRTGRTDVEGVLQGWVRREAHALERGFAGLRLTGNTFFVDAAGWRDFADYEERVNALFSERRVLALCSYCLGKCGATEVLDVVANHAFALARREGEWTLVESGTLKLAKEALAKLNHELEGRVADRTSALEQALRVRDDFLAVASHELKTPIAAMQLSIEGLVRAHERGELPPEETVRRLKRAQDACHRVDALVGRLLDVSRVREGGLPLYLARMDLAELAREIGERFAEHFRAMSTELRVHAAEPVVGAWDRLRLEQVLTNLVTNALKYAPGRPVDVSVGTAAGRAVLEVRDQGPGLRPQDLELLFQRFTPLAQRRHGGFGLGLWIVRQIVEALGGRVSAECPEGGGTCFRVVLPLPS